MTKNEIANNVTGNYERLNRVIASYFELDIKVGDIWDNRGKVESWAGPGSTMNFEIESYDKNDEIYELYIENACPAHKVDYSDMEITDLLGATGCESEGEYLVPENAILRITDIYEPDEDEVSPVWAVYLTFEGFNVR